MSGADIAAEIAAALAEAGEAVGQGPYACTIRRSGNGGKPWQPQGTGPSLHAVTALEDINEVRDASGTLIGVSKRTLTVNATGLEPRKSDMIAVGIAPDDVTEDTKFETIDAVRPIAPGGVPLMYELDLAL